MKFVCLFSGKAGSVPEGSPADNPGEREGATGAEEGRGYFQGKD